MCSRLFRVGVGAAGVAFRARLVQMPPPPGWDGPRWLFSELASGDGARLQTRFGPLGAVPGRFVRGLVRCAACGSVPVIRGGAFHSSPPGRRNRARGVPGRTPRGFPSGVPLQALYGRLVAAAGCAGQSALGPFRGRSCRTPGKRRKSRRGCVRRATAPGRLRAWARGGLLPGRRTPRGLEVGPWSVAPRKLHPLVCLCRCGVLGPWMERCLRDPRSAPRCLAVVGGRRHARRPALVHQVPYRDCQCPVPRCLRVPPCPAGDWRRVGVLVPRLARHHTRYPRSGWSSGV